MNVDVRTLFVVHSIVSITLALLLVVFWRAHRRMPGLGHWTLGAGLLGLGVLGGGLRGAIPDFLFQSNTRNLRIIKRHLDKHHPETATLQGEVTARGS